MRHPELGRLMTRIGKTQNDLAMAGMMEKLGHQLSVMPDTIHRWRRLNKMPIWNGSQVTVSYNTTFSDKPSS